MWDDQSLGNANIGDVLTGKGTVKDHSEYKGERQTVLTRCSFEVQ